MHSTLTDDVLLVNTTNTMLYQ